MSDWTAPELRRFVLWLLVICVALTAVWTSRSYLACERIESQQSRKEQQQEGLSSFFVVPRLIWNVETRCNGAFIDSNANAIVAVFTIVLAFSTILLWRETERLAEGAADQSKKMVDAIKATNAVANRTGDVAAAMDEAASAMRRVAGQTERLAVETKASAERQLRAYVNLEEGKLFNVGTNDPWYAIVKLKNGGQTPAYDVKTHFSIEGDHWPIQKPILPIPDKHPEGGRGILGPNAEYTGVLSVKDAPSKHHTEAMQAGNAIVWVTGRVTYRDIFGKPQWTTFRIFAGGPLGYDDKGVMAPHETGNDAS